MTDSPLLALGTAQMGMDYGVAGRGAPMPIKEIERTLSLASEIGVEVLDTAPAYGSAEFTLSRFLNKLSFRVVSKIPSIPMGLTQDESRKFIKEKIDSTVGFLGDNVSTILFHNHKSLLGENGHFLWEFTSNYLSQRGIKIGVSCYSPSETEAVLEEFPIEVVQLPANILDKRLSKPFDNNALKVHIRSVFLQGLLLMPLSEVERKMPWALPHMETFHSWCKEHDLSAMEAALSYIKTLDFAEYFFIGVDSYQQLNTVINAWQNNTSKINFFPDGCDDVSVIDPRCWVNKIKEEAEDEKM